MDVEKLVSAYIKLRDAKTELKREFDEKAAEILEKMDAIEAKLLEVAQETGTESLRTKSGTAIRTVKTRYWAPDWDSFKDFLLELEDGGYDLVEHRIHQGNFRAYVEENPDAKPPVNVDSRYAITVRRSNK